MGILTRFWAEISNLEMTYVSCCGQNCSLFWMLHLKFECLMACKFLVLFRPPNLKCGYTNSFVFVFMHASIHRWWSRWQLNFAIIDACWNLNLFLSRQLEKVVTQSNLVLEIQNKTSSIYVNKDIETSGKRSEL